MDDDDERKPSLVPDPTRAIGGQGDGVEIEISDARRLLERAAHEWLRSHAAAASGELAANGAWGEVRVRIVDDAEMAAAHARHSGVEGTTDVLTFDLRTDRERGTHPKLLDADVLVCADEARRQAQTRGHAPERELLLYILHAMLHCLGHDDHDDEAFARMHAEEDRLLARIGVGATFGAPRGECRC